MLKNSKSQELQLIKYINFQKENNINQQSKKPIKEDRKFGRDIKNKLIPSQKANSNSHSKNKKKPKNKTKYELKIHKATRDTLALISKTEALYSNNPQYVTDYSSAIIDHLKETETINRPNYASIFNLQNKITEKTRVMLIDWLIAVHDRFDLLPQTLYMAIHILDRYTCLKHMELSQYQLLGIVSMFIASKYEEIYAPEIRDFIFVTKKTFTKENIILMECKILSSLKFDLITVSAYQFLLRYHFLSGDDSLIPLHLAQYIIEISSLKISLSNYCPNLLASTALSLSWKVLKESNENRKAYMVILQLHSGYKEKDMNKCMKEMVLLIQKVIKSHKNALYDKFSSEKYSNVANIFSEDDLYENTYSEDREK